jgi:hypothetical protein
LKHQQETAGKGTRIMATEITNQKDEDNDIIEADVHIKKTPEPDVEEDFDLNW